MVDVGREEEVPHHTFSLPSERNIHAVIRVHATLSEIEIKEELQQRGYSPLHIIRLKRGGGVSIPLVAVILPKIEKSQQLFNEHELLVRATCQRSGFPSDVVSGARKYYVLIERKGYSTGSGVPGFISSSLKAPQCPLILLCKSSYIHSSRIPHLILKIETRDIGI
ncbi:unnamed protein product [Acanthoscelides obtectus]|uniref:Uncharacterized protein n=1 Tax=Acanthoscelides obtectus TaxID=200917 RepID=A0A9P0LFJ3_ACAOB|nr:unnamed protein product [Acanthoscelides obtectus]CAK1656863.1 hypothetical protein AOBTE_LOCUS19974 [Acanthoscelides obtectus]